MVYLFVSFLLAILLKITVSQLQHQYNVHVTPSCDQKMIKVVLTFDEKNLPGGQFEDWIVVGTNNKRECRLKGNGELQYVVELAIFNDPCETFMPATGVFENRLRIGQNPAVILQGDKTYIIRCVYGLPEVNQLDAPSINPSFNAVTLPEVHTAPTFESVKTISDVVSKEVEPDEKQSLSWSVVLATAGGLFFFVFTLLLAFVCFQMRLDKRKKIQQESTNNQKGTIAYLNAPTSNFGLVDSWWGNRNAIRCDKLQTLNNSNERSTGTTSTAQRSTIHLMSSMSSDASTTASEPTTTALQGSAPSSDHSNIQSSTKDFNMNATDDTPHSYSEWRSRILANLDEHCNEVNLDRCSSLRVDAKAVSENPLSEVRSITEIYRSAEMAVAETDTLSQSTLEGVSYSLNQDYDDRIENLIKCVQKIRGIGPHKLTEQDYGRWRRLIISNEHLRESLLKCMNIKEMHELCSSGEYKKQFTREKWDAIIKCIVESSRSADVSRHFAKRNDLNRQDLCSSSLNVYIGGVRSDSGDW